MTEMLWKKEALHEVDWVKEQTKSALSDLQKEVLYTKNGDEVKFDVDTSLDYLKTLKDKKTYKEVMAKNSWATVMAVQILLKNKWYNIGKIDGILKTQWKSTSKTMEAIAKFQSDNWLTPDGAPGPKTIKKILEVYENWWNSWWDDEVENEDQVKDLTEEEFEALCEKTELTDDEVKQLVKYTNKYDKWLYLSWLTSITDKQAEELWKVKEWLELDWLTSITDKQAEELWKVKEWLNLDWLTSITDKQAEELWKVEYLVLNWLTSITDKQATKLAKVKSLSIQEEILTPKQKQILKKHLSS